MKENNHFKDLRTDEQIILKLILKRTDGRACFVTEKSEEFLYTC